MKTATGHVVVNTNGDLAVILVHGQQTVTIPATSAEAALNALRGVTLRKPTRHGGSNQQNKREILSRLRAAGIETTNRS